MMTTTSKMAAINRKHMHTHASENLVRHVTQTDDFYQNEAATGEHLEKQ